MSSNKIPPIKPLFATLVLFLIILQLIGFPLDTRIFTSDMRYPTAANMLQGPIDQPTRTLQPNTDGFMLGDGNTPMYTVNSNSLGYRDENF